MGDADHIHLTDDDPAALDALQAEALRRGDAGEPVLSWVVYRHDGLALDSHAVALRWGPPRPQDPAAWPAWEAARREAMRAAAAREGGVVLGE